MKTVIIKYSELANLASQMSQMRWWLDARSCAPSRFQYHFAGQNLLVEVEFDEDSKAEEFLHAFDGVESEYVTLLSTVPRSRESMAQVCWWRLTAEEIRTEADEFGSEAAREAMVQVASSYDRMAEDLEKRLANPRYRDGSLSTYRELFTEPS